LHGGSDLVELSGLRPFLFCPDPHLPGSKAHLARCGDQLGWRERLGQNRQPAVRLHLAGRARHGQHGKAGTENGEYLGDFLPAQSGHREVGNDELDMIVIFDQLERCFSILRLEDRTSVLL